MNQKLASALLATVITLGGCTAAGEEASSQPSSTPGPSAEAATATPLPTPTPTRTPAPTAIPIHSPVAIGHFNLTKSSEPATLAGEILAAIGANTGDAEAVTMTEDGGTSVRFPLPAGDWWVLWGDTGQLDGVLHDTGDEPNRVVITVSDDDALKQARAYLAAVGIPQPIADPDNGVSHEIAGPYMSWPRKEAGYYVAGDGVTVQLNGDGDLDALTYGWHALAPKPAHLITASQASAKIKTACDDPSAEGTCGDPALVWTSLSGWDPPDSSVQHLYWVITQYPGFWYVDAGTGEANFLMAQI